MSLTEVLAALCDHTDADPLKGGCVLTSEIRELLTAHGELPGARFHALTEAWQVVDQAVRPLGPGGSTSPWCEGYERAKSEALNAILALRASAPQVIPADVLDRLTGNQWLTHSGGRIADLADKIADAPPSAGTEREDGP